MTTTLKQQGIIIAVSIIGAIAIIGTALVAKGTAYENAWLYVTGFVIVLLPLLELYSKRKTGKWYNETMQKIATKVFTYASLAFGILGILVILTASERDADNSDLNKILMKLLIITVFIILPSFALSVAGKYLNGKS